MGIIENESNSKTEENFDGSVRVVGSEGISQDDYEEIAAGVEDDIDDYSIDLERLSAMFDDAEEWGEDNVYYMDIDDETGQYVSKPAEEVAAMKARLSKVNAEVEKSSYLSPELLNEIKSLKVDDEEKRILSSCGLDCNTTQPYKLDALPIKVNPGSQLKDYVRKLCELKDISFHSVDCGILKGTNWFAQFGFSHVAYGFTEDICEDSFEIKGVIYMENFSGINRQLKDSIHGLLKVESEFPVKYQLLMAFRDDEEEGIVKSLLYNC